MKTKLVFVLFVVSFFTCGSAISSNSIPVTFEQLDSDADGLITLTEGKVRSDIEENWKSIDKNKDGNLDVSEYAVYEGKNRFSPPEESETAELGAAPIR